VRGDASVDGFRVSSFWNPDSDVGVSKPEGRVDVGGDFGVGFEDLLELDVDELEGKKK